MAKWQRNYTFNSEWEDQYCFIEYKGKLHSNYVSTIYILLIKHLFRVRFSSVIIFINITINITLLLLLLFESPHGARASTAN
jgi:hypothetical protein